MFLACRVNGGFAPCSAAIQLCQRQRQHPSPRVVARSHDSESVNGSYLGLCNFAVSQCTPMYTPNAPTAPKAQAHIPPQALSKCPCPHSMRSWPSRAKASSWASGRRTKPSEQGTAGLMLKATQHHHNHHHNNKVQPYTGAPLPFWQRTSRKE